MVQHQLYSQRTREPNLQNVRSPVGIAPLPLEFFQSRPFTRSLGRVLFYIGVFVSRGTKIRPEFCSAFIEGNRVPEVSDATVRHGEWKTMGDQADGIDRVPVWGRSRPCDASRQGTGTHQTPRNSTSTSMEKVFLKAELCSHPNASS